MEADGSQLKATSLCRSGENRTGGESHAGRKVLPYFNVIKCIKSSVEL